MILILTQLIFRKKFVIHTVLETIKDELELYLKNSFGLDEQFVVLNKLIEQDGNVPQHNQDKVVITLINLEHETSQQYIGSQQRLSGSSFSVTNPAALFNIEPLFSANFDDYKEALKFLNATISFFHTNNSINAKNTPELSSDLQALHFEIENYSNDEIQSLWSAMGAKYQPSIIYKIRHVTVQADRIHTVSKLPS